MSGFSCGPRASGDEPVVYNRNMTELACSPRERG